MNFKPLKKSTSAIALLTYFLYALYIFYPSASSTGVINGEDAGNPITPSQVMVAFELGSSTLSFGNVLTYKNFIAGAALPLQLLHVIFSKVGLTTQFPAFVFIITYAMAANGIFFLARRLGCNIAASYFAGGIYVSSPIFFNYTIFGWNYVLIAMAIMPYATFFFIRSLERGSQDDAIKSGVLFFFATLQSQSFLWFPIIYIAVVLSVRSQPWVVKLRTITITIATGLLLNLHVILPALFFPDPALQGSSYVFSGASLGTTAHFYPLNTLRLFGGLFNYQYENIFQSPTGALCTFIFSGMAICGLLTSKVESHRSYTNAALILFCIPLFIWILSFNREILVHIPFSNVFRDLARFSVLSAFGLALLIAFGINSLTLVGSTFLRYLVYFLSTVTLCIFAFPFVNGNLYYDGPRRLFDSRLSHFELDQNYLQVEKFLTADHDDFKVIYLPISFNATVKSLSHPQFKDGVRDIFSIYSPKPGLFSLDDRGRGDESEFSHLMASLQSDLKVFNGSNIKYFIFRNDVESYIVDLVGGSTDDSIIYNTLVRNAEIALENGVVTIFKNVNWREKVSLNAPNPGRLDLKTNAMLSFVRVDPTLYLVVLRSEPGDVAIRFLESFSNLWRLTVIPEEYLNVMQVNLFDSSSVLDYLRKILMKLRLQYDLLFASEYAFVDHSPSGVGGNDFNFSIQDLCSSAGSSCRVEPDGSRTIFLAIEYGPQKYFSFLLLTSFLLFFLFVICVFLMRDQRNPY